MGFRFQKRIRIFKGLTLNLSKSGSSWTVGRPGASVNIREDKVTGNVGVPGTGLSYRQTLNDPNEGSPEAKDGGAKTLIWIAVIAVVFYLIWR